MSFLIVILHSLTLAVHKRIMVFFNLLDGIDEWKLAFSLRLLFVFYICNAMLPFLYEFFLHGFLRISFHIFTPFF